MVCSLFVSCVVCSVLRKSQNDASAFILFVPSQQLPIAYCLLPIAYCLLPTAYCLLPTAYCLLPIAYCLLPIACYCPTISSNSCSASFLISEAMKASVMAVRARVSFSFAPG